MCRNTNLVYHSCNLILKDMFVMRNTVVNRFFYIDRLYINNSSNIFNAVNQHIIIKRFHNIICSSHIESILCHCFPSNCTNNNKCRINTIIILPYPLHNS